MRLIIKSCRLRDATGSVGVDVVSTAVPALYGRSDGDEVKEYLTTQSLTSVKVRMNARCVLR